MVKRFRFPRQLPKLRSPLARAAVPVVAGLVFFAVLGAITYLVAAVVSGNSEGIRIGDKQFTIGRADIAAQRIAKYGPLLYADLKGTLGEQAIVVDHDPRQPDTEGWTVYFAYRADRGLSCLVSVDRESQKLKDCDGEPVTVSELQPAAPEAEVVIELDKQPVVKVRFAAAQTTTTTIAPTTSASTSTG